MKQRKPVNHKGNQILHSKDGTWKEPIPMRIVKVEGERRTGGTCFLIQCASQSFGVTAPHCIRGGKTYQQKRGAVDGTPGELCPAWHVHPDPSVDMALCYLVPGNGYSEPAEAEKGAMVFSAGYPVHMRGEILITKGSAASGPKEGLTESGAPAKIDFYFPTMTSEPGRSGSPVINQSGKLVGLVTVERNEAPFYTGCISACRVFEFANVLIQQKMKSVAMAKTLENFSDSLGSLPAEKKRALEDAFRNQAKKTRRRTL